MIGTVIATAPVPVVAQTAGSSAVADSMLPLRIPPNEHLVADPAGYTRYQRPAQCHNTAMRAYRYYWRARRADTVSYESTRLDTVPDTVKVVARACLSKFDINQVPVHELSDVATVALWSGDEEIAKAALDRRWAADSARSPEIQATALYAFFDAYLSARPVRTTEAVVISNRLAALGKPAGFYRFAAANILTGKLMEQDRLRDVLAQGALAIAGYRDMSQADQLDEVFDLSHVYDRMADAAYWLDGVEAAETILKQAEQHLLSLREPGSQQYMILKNGITGKRQLYARYGKPAQPIEAGHWFNTGGDSAARPQNGKVTLVYFTSPNCGGGCYEYYTLVREFHRKFASRGLEVVFVGATSGYFRNKLQPSAAAEIEISRRYLLDYLKLPGVLAMTETQFSRRYDRARIPEPDRNRAAYGPYSLAIVDREGKLVYLGSPLRFTVKRIDALLTQLTAP